MRDLQKSIDRLNIVIQEEEGNCTAIENLLKKPEKEWTSDDRLQHISKNALREKEASIETKIHKFREELNKLMTQKLDIMERKIE